MRGGRFGSVLSEHRPGVLDIAAMQVQHEERKGTLGETLAIVLGCLVACLILLLARERRLRKILTVALRWLLVGGQARGR